VTCRNLRKQEIELQENRFLIRQPTFEPIHQRYAFRNGRTEVSREANSVSIVSLISSLARTTPESRHGDEFAGGRHGKA